jgi:hypothetical protein
MPLIPFIFESAHPDYKRPYTSCRPSHGESLDEVKNQLVNLIGDLLHCYNDFLKLETYAEYEEYIFSEGYMENQAFDFNVFDYEKVRWYSPWTHDELYHLAHLPYVRTHITEGANEHTWNDNDAEAKEFIRSYLEKHKAEYEDYDELMLIIAEEDALIASN